MSTEIQSANSKRFVTGIALIALGVVWLLSEFVDLNIGYLVLPGLGLIFLFWGIGTREGGLIIPGGILLGLGASVWIVKSSGLDGQTAAGTIMLGLAAGFASIILLTRLFTNCTFWWAAWPAGVMTVIGAALLVGGLPLQLLGYVEKLWPIALIVVGVVFLVRSGSRSS